MQAVRRLLVFLVGFLGFAASAHSAIVYQYTSGPDSFSVTAPALGSYSVDFPHPDDSCVFAGLVCRASAFFERAWRVEFEDNSIITGLYAARFEVGKSPEDTGYVCVSCSDAAFNAAERISVGQLVIDESGNPMPEPGTLTLVAVAGALALRSRRRVSPGGLQLQD